MEGQSLTWSHRLRRRDRFSAVLCWERSLAAQGYRRAQHLDSLEPDPGWTPPLGSSPGGGQLPVGDIYLVHGTFLNGEQTQKGDAHWIVENGTARWITTPCVSS